MPGGRPVEAAVALGRGKKRLNALTAILCGGVPAIVLAVWFPASPTRWLVGFLVGVLWGNAFEYVYHRFLLHQPGSPLARRHLVHHATVGTPDEAEHVNLGGSPVWVALLFLTNGIPLVALDWLFGWRIAPAVFAAWVAYLLAVEEVHWRFHAGGWLPPGVRAARQFHLDHHDRPDSRFSVFLPLFDWLFGPARS